VKTYHIQHFKAYSYITQTEIPFHQ